MKSALLFCLITLLPFVLLAQKPPLSATLTKPGSQTIKFDPKQKIPPILLPCLLSNGKPRPFDCEFSFDQLQFIGNDGSILATVKPVKGQPAPTPLPFKKAKKSAPAGQAGLITYTVRVNLTRRHKPAFPVSKGYQIRSCNVVACLQSDAIATVLNGIMMPPGISDQIILAFDLSWIYSKKGGQMIGPHELYIENDVTTTKFKFSSEVSMRDKSEAWIDINPTISGDPSPSN